LGYFALLLFPKKIKTTSLGVCVHLPIPYVVKIGTGQLGQKLTLLLVVQPFYRIDDLGNCAHAQRIIRSHSESKRQKTSSLRQGYGLAGRLPTAVTPQSSAKADSPTCLPRRSLARRRVTFRYRTCRFCFD